jgi:hypothetical protein
MRLLDMLVGLERAEGIITGFSHCYKASLE